MRHDPVVGRETGLAQHPNDINHFLTGCCYILPQRPHIIGVMPHLDLDDEQAAALATLLTRTIGGDRHPYSPHTQTLTEILAKLQPQPVSERLPPTKDPRITSTARYILQMASKGEWKTVAYINDLEEVRHTMENIPELRALDTWENIEVRFNRSR